VKLHQSKKMHNPAKWFCSLGKDAYVPFSKMSILASATNLLKGTRSLSCDGSGTNELQLRVYLIWFQIHCELEMFQFLLRNDS
jgi:hypothetical protein